MRPIQVQSTQNILIANSRTVCPKSVHMLKSSFIQFLIAYIQYQESILKEVWFHSEEFSDLSVSDDMSADEWAEMSRRFDETIRILEPICQNTFNRVTWEQRYQFCVDSLFKYKSLLVRSIEMIRSMRAILPSDMGRMNNWLYKEHINILLGIYDRFCQMCDSQETGELFKRQMKDLMIDADYCVEGLVAELSIISHDDIVEISIRTSMISIIDV